MKQKDFMREQRPFFIISSGRTGSTFLAHRINQHPDILIVSDLFEPVGDEPYFHPGRIVSGTEFWDILKRPSFPQRIKSWRAKPNAELLFLPPDDDMVSLLLSYTIPFLTDKPMQLFEELEVKICAFPKDSIQIQLIRFFDLLREMFGKQIWIERTGGSLPHTEKILKLWPDAKVVHNIRDCRETALSMMKGSFFRLYLELENDINMGEWDETYFPPVEEMAAMLNRWIVDAEAAFAQFPEEQQMRLSFEEVLDNTEQSLLKLIEFFLEREPNDIDIKWAKEQAAVTKRPKLRFPDLDPDTQARLSNAVAEGMHLLGYV